MSILGALSKRVDEANETHANRVRSVACEHLCTCVCVHTCTHKVAWTNFSPHCVCVCVCVCVCAMCKGLDTSLGCA